MRRSTIALFAFAGLVIVGCSKRSGGGDPELGPNGIAISSLVDGEKSDKGSKTLAASGADIAGIQILRADDLVGGKTSISFADSIPKSVTRKSDTDLGQIVWVDPQPEYDVLTDKTAYFMAYYPAGTPTLGVQTTWAPDGATDILVSRFYSAGKYTVKKTGPMEFGHALARLEIILQAKGTEKLAEVQKMWGKITKVTVDGIQPELVFDYGSNALTATGTAGNVELLKGDTYITTGTTDGVIEAHDASPVKVKFASMLVPASATSLKLHVFNETVELGELETEVTAALMQNAVAAPFSAGKTHQITLVFGIESKIIEIKTSTIDAWGSGGTATPELPKPPKPSWIEINGLKWATGNLVADASVTPGSGGVGANTNGTKVKIGEPTDGGLYFQFGSLIGYKGGNAASNGTGRGIPHGATTTAPMPDDKYWNQATTYSWANDAMVWPQAYATPAATWPKNLIANSYYFGLQTPPYSSAGQKLSAFPDWESGGLVTTDIAVGDPCRYYLGGAWRMPTAEDWGKLFNSVYANGTVGGTWPGAGPNWVYGTATKTVMAGVEASINSPTEGKGIYANTAATTEADAKADPNALFFPASGYRYNGDGSFYGVGRSGYSWSGSVYTATNGFNLSFTTTYVYPQGSNYRSFGFPVRCVSEP